MDFLGIGPLEFVAIAVVAFLVLGPSKMAELARGAGRALNEIRRSVREIGTVVQDEEIEVDSARREKNANSSPKGDL